MTNKNSCYTYFRIVGDFDPHKVTQLLNLTPDEYWSAGDFRKNGTRYDFSSWKYGTCSEYDVDTSEQMRKTISGLLDKIDLLKKIRNENDVSFVLEVVPTVCVGESMPCLAPSLDIIDFCHLTRTEIDIDIDMSFLTRKGKKRKEST